MNFQTVTGKENLKMFELALKLKKSLFSFRYNFIFLIILFLLLKITFLFKENFVISFTGDLILIPIVYSFVKHLIRFQEKKKFSQIQLLLGFIKFEIFFILFSETSLYILSPILKDLKGLLVKPTIFIGLISGFYTFVYLLFISIILAILTILFFTRQKKNIERYYKTTIFLLILGSLSSHFQKYFDASFLEYTFGSLSVVFFILMSYLNKWVIYLSRKEKIKVIIICNILLAIVIYSMIKSGDDTGINDLIPIFSNATLTAYKFIYAFAFVYPIILQILIIFQLPVTEVIEKKTSEVESLQNLSQMISKVLDIEELVSIIIQTIERITSSRDVFICLIDEKSNCKFYSNISESRNLFDRLSQLLTSKLNQTNEKILEIDVNEFYSEENHQIEKLIIIPLVYNKKLIGYILIGKDRASILDEDDLNTLKSIGEYSAIAIQNHHLLQKSIEKERLEKELEVAREVQKKLIPENTPSIKNLDIAHTFIPAFEVGGDYIDYFQLDENYLGFIIADVSGKGISAAFYMAEVKGIFESLSKILKNPKDILIQANKILCKSLDRKSFVSVVYAIIDLQKGYLRIARAGHCPILFLKNSELVELIPSGIALGLISNELFENNLEEVFFELEKNDLLLLYTDGVTEARNQNLEEFGTDRLNEIVKKSEGDCSNEIIQNIIEELTIFSKEYPQHDDITLLAIKYLGDKNERV